MDCIDAIDREFFSSRASAVVIGRVNARLSHARDHSDVQNQTMAAIKPRHVPRQNVTPAFEGLMNC